jgi:hypothetical protein
MPYPPPASRPVDTYKQIIDSIVECSPSLGARLVNEQAIFSNAEGREKMNELVRSLTSEQRSLLAEMLTEERVGAIHDVLAELTWWIDCREVGLTYRGEAMPSQLSGMGLHGDYIGRQDDWEWPNAESKA